MLQRTAKCVSNTGDLLLGWDTDQFPTNVYETTEIMLIVLQNGGLAPGGRSISSTLDLRRISSAATSRRPT